MKSVLTVDDEGSLQCQGQSQRQIMLHLEDPSKQAGAGDQEGWQRRLRYIMIGLHVHTASCARFPRLAGTLALGGLGIATRD